MNEDPDLRFQNAREFRKALVALYEEIDGGHIKTAGIHEEERKPEAEPAPVSVPQANHNPWTRFQSRIVDFIINLRRRTKR